MDIVQILFVCAVIVPAISVSIIMLFVKNSKGGLNQTKRVFEQKEMAYKEKEIAYKEKEKTHKKIITSLENVIEKQDNVLEIFRDTHSN